MKSIFVIVVLLFVVTLSSSSLVYSETTFDSALEASPDFAWEMFLPAIIGNTSFAYPGRWIGSFSGTDTGDWQVTIGEHGRISGWAWSNDLNTSVDIEGQVRNGNKFVAYASGQSSIDTVFTGTISAPGVISGTWQNDGFNESGTFEGERLLSTDQYLLTFNTTFDNMIYINPSSCSYTVGWTVGVEITSNPDRILYPLGEDVFLSVTVLEGDCKFTGYSGDCSGTEGGCNLSMDSDKHVIAHFEWIP